MMGDVEYLRDSGFNKSVGIRMNDGCGCTDDTACAVMEVMIRRWLADPSVEGLLAAICQHDIDRRAGQI